MPRTRPARTSAPTSKALIERVTGDVEKLGGSKDKPVPVDLVTTSGSGLDPHISPAAAAWQVPRVAKARGLPEADLQRLVAQNTEGRELGVLASRGSASCGSISPSTPCPSNDNDRGHGPR